MTDRRTELLALAERVEREPASPVLAATVLEACGFQVHFSTAHGHFLKGTPSDQPIPNPLQSLDAAVGLVPEGCDWDVQTCVSAKAPSACAHVEELRADEDGFQDVFIHDGFASTPAAALTAACLRALAEMETDNGRALKEAQ